MTQPSADTSDEDRRDSRIATIVEDLTARTERGEVVDINDVIREHPDVADDIREIWGTLMVAKAVAQPTPGSNAGDVSDAYSDVELPCQFGNYELIEQIGRGGMGLVFRARDLRLGRIVAVKMLLRGRFASTEDKVRFKQEALSAARLNHPGIVSVFEVGEHEDRMYFSMPLVAGETLAQRLERGLMPQRRAARLMIEVARAVHYAHEQGVIHRDLKPSNILIDENGKPHVTDLGLARPCLLYTSPSPRDATLSRMPSSA